MAVSTDHGSFEWVWLIGEESEARKFHVKAKMENPDKVYKLQRFCHLISLNKKIKKYHTLLKFFAFFLPIVTSIAMDWTGAFNTEANKPNHRKWVLFCH